MPAFALSFADMHLSPALGTRLAPRGRRGFQRDDFFGRLAFGFFEAFFIRLNFGTLRMNSGCRVRNLPTDRTDFAFR